MKSLREFPLVLVAVAALLTSCRPAEDAKIIDLGGTIRNQGQGWYIVSDGPHAPLNLQAVRAVIDPTGPKARGDYLEITHEVGAKKVITFAVTVDETMAKEGYTVGISGGVSMSKIYLYDRSGNTVNPLTYQNERGNIWIYGKLMK